MSTANPIGIAFDIARRIGFLNLESTMWLRVAHFAVGVVLILMVMQTAIYWSQLPEPVASHFDAAGNPNDHLSKVNFFAMYFSVQIGTAVLMLGIGALMRVLPASLINVPCKDYWLAPENRSKFFRLSDTMLAWSTLLTLAFIGYAIQLTIRANIGQQPLDSFWFFSGLIVYLVLITCALARFMIPLLKVKSE